MTTVLFESGASAEMDLGSAYEPIQSTDPTQGPQRVIEYVRIEYVDLIPDPVLRTNKPNDRKKKRINRKQKERGF